MSLRRARTKALRRAEIAVAGLAEEAWRDGYMQALLDVEREIYGCESSAEFFAWLNELLSTAEAPV